MPSKIRYTLQMALCLSAFGTTPPALCAPSSFEDCRMASNTELDAMRGGFEVNVNGTQIMLALSLERVTYINGVLVSSMKISLPDLASLGTNGIPPNAISVQTIPPAGAGTGQGNSTSSASMTPQQISDFGQTVNVIQNGTGNTFLLPQSLNSLTTVIQNTIDNQMIRNMTTINATVINQALARAMELTASINQAIANSVR